MTSTTSLLPQYLLGSMHKQGPQKIRQFILVPAKCLSLKQTNLR